MQLPLQDQLVAVLSKDQNIIVHRADDTGIHYSVYRLGSACIEPSDYQEFIDFYINHAPDVPRTLRGNLLQGGL